MCGISGYVSERIFDDTLILESQHHRGPDSSGTYHELLEGTNINVVLNHNRLSIIDLSEAGSQPMFTEDKNYAIIYNGEVYNFEQLRDKYLKNIPLKSKTDTEVILYLYRLLGINFVKELNGDFAISIFDRIKKKIILLRDRFGVKPLYYYFRNKTLVFASEIKAILATGIDFRLNDENLEKYFVFKYVPEEGTLYKDIYRLSPAHALEYDIINDELNIERYWTLNKNSEYKKLSYDDAKKKLFELLGDSVKIRLMSDVPVGTFLSGGIDSSIIAWYLRNNDKIIHYTARKSEADLKKEGTSSDFYYAELFAKQFNLKMIPVDISSQEANFDLIRKTIFYSDDLIADGSQIPSYLITKEATKISKVMLSGMGADELFFGYKNHLQIMLSQYLDKFPRFISRGIAGYLKNIKQGKGFMKSYRRHLHILGKYYGYSNLKYGFFGLVGDYKNSMSVIKSPNDICLPIFAKYFNDSEDTFDSTTRFELNNFLVKNLHYVDRMCMANSVEGRVPFLDYRLAEFAFSIPREYKLSGTGVTKRIIKDTYKEYLPQGIINRKKAGFGMPLRSIFSSKDKVYELLERDFFGSFDIFSVDNIDSLISKHISGHEDNSAIIYSLICFQEWYKMAKLVK
ncbi:MAG: asparagine synthase (glutamine-hydrolyzing) [Bacteroidota bacterium]|nr:asparagine synthase (glutamine-hydrolyzing) [Bacteroidota bacterium]